jgi:hypothetical protein
MESETKKKAAVFRQPGKAEAGMKRGINGLPVL